MGERVLGVDPGVKSVGLAFYGQSGRMRWLTRAYPLSDTKSIQEFMEIALRLGITRIAIEWGPDGQARAGKPMLQSRIELLMLWAGIAHTTERFIVYPTTWQSACGLIGKGKKSHTDHATKILGADLDLKQHDEADAVCIAAYAQSVL